MRALSLLGICACMFLTSCAEALKMYSDYQRDRPAQLLREERKKTAESEAAAAALLAEQADIPPDDGIPEKHVE